VTNAELLQRFQGVRALVVGDLMLDEYVHGTVNRISPEAPVMVVHQERTSSVPGGAANVAANLTALGAKTTLSGVIGDDESGRSLISLFDNLSNQRFLPIVDSDRPTTRKVRILADSSHQVLRVDYERQQDVPDQVALDLLNSIRESITAVDVVVLSCYAKGALVQTVVTGAIELAKQHSVPVVANVKPRTAGHYRGATLVQMNRAETSTWARLERTVDDLGARSLAQDFRNSIGADAALITLGSSGLVWACSDEVHHLPATKVEVFDTAGAGDTVVATVALGLACFGFNDSVFRLATQTSACVVKKAGVATPSPEDLAKICQIN
jgi:D-beta-D-heptose 7-phosphate kinase/D-beta-D-heptose 1-phosphate adenosyltransferase